MAKRGVTGFSTFPYRCISHLYISYKGFDATKWQGSILTGVQRLAVWFRSRVVSVGDEMSFQWSGVVSQCAPTGLWQLASPLHLAARPKRAETWQDGSHGRMGQTTRVDQIKRLEKCQKSGVCNQINTSLTWRALGSLQDQIQQIDPEIDVSERDLSSKTQGFSLLSINPFLDHSR